MEFGYDTYALAPGKVIVVVASELGRSGFSHFHDRPFLGERVVLSYGVRPGSWRCPDHRDGFE